MVSLRYYLSSWIPQVSKYAISKQQASEYAINNLYNTSPSQILLRSEPRPEGKKGPQAAYHKQINVVQKDFFRINLVT
jgi:hypothetical protein